MKIRSLYDEDRQDKGQEPVGKSLTHQCFADDADINQIINRYETNGYLVDQKTVNLEREGTFEDVSEVPTYSDMLRMVNDAKNAFFELPAQVRANFDNDPALFLDAYDRDPVGFLRDQFGILPDDGQSGSGLEADSDKQPADSVEKSAGSAS